MSIRGIGDVTERQLCTGCGVCAYLRPDDIRMVDALDHGRRPIVESRSSLPVIAGDALAACPGAGLTRPPCAGTEGAPEHTEEWGPVLEVWEGYAGDGPVRFAGSSGGAASALAIHCLEHEGMHGVLHAAARPDVPYLNHTVLSRSRDDVLAAAGSRYAPASPCDGLQEIEDAPASCVFIGKPCDVAATCAAAQLRPGLAAKLGLTIGVFCAGTPTTRGTIEMLRSMGVRDVGRVTSVRYRGNGWPGRAEVVEETDGGPITHRLSYDESWGQILQQHRQWRCHVCADHTGEFADIAVGDPWYRSVEPGEAGRSLIVVRTERGRRILQSALHAGSVVAERIPIHLLEASQPNLLRTRGAVWGRVLACRLSGIPAPRYRGMSLHRAWWRRLTGQQKAQSLLGTVRRAVRRRLYRRTAVMAFQETTDQHAVVGADHV